MDNGKIMTLSGHYCIVYQGYSANNNWHVLVILSCWLVSECILYPSNKKVTEKILRLQW